MTTNVIDILGAADSDWNLKETIKVLPDGIGIGIFDGKETFGDAAPVITKCLASAKLSMVRVHASWNNHKLTPTNLLKQRCQKYESISRHTTVPIFVSPSCEYDSKNKADVEEQIKIVRKYAPSCTPVLSPLPGAYRMPGIIIESHGVDARTSGPLQAASTDGQALFDINAIDWLNKNTGLYRAAWGYRLNLSESGPRILPPYKRTAAPNARYITSLIRLFDRPAPAPVIPINFIPIRSPLLYKSHAEDNPGFNTRDNLPLLLLKKKLPEIIVIAMNGTALGKFKYFDTFPGGRFRYYSGMPGAINKYGWEIADMAFAKSGSPYVAFVAGKETYGPVHPTIRQGFFHD